VDSGVTLSYLVNLLGQRKPKSIKIVALLDKPERRLRQVDVAYVGFTIPDEFFVGYGFELDERYRSLPDLRLVR
jgi:hypoxanthine phosphoribosyltransferase